MEKTKYSFTIVDDNGQEIECDALSVMTGKDNNVYLLYTDYKEDENGKLNLLMSQVVQEKDNYRLKKIEDSSKIKEFDKYIKEATEYLASEEAK